MTKELSTIVFNNVITKYFREAGKFNPELIKNELFETRFWNWLSLRKSPNNTKHNDVDDIVLRFQPVQSNYNFQDFMDKEECVDYFVQQYFPVTMELCNMFAAPHHVGRIVIAKLKPKGVIDLHIDEGEYNKQFRRFHFVVDTNDDVVFTCRDETINMPEGTIWEFDNKVIHKVENLGDTDRVHIIMDIKYVS